MHRTDHRHNFSPFYYPFYLLDAQEAQGLAQNALYQSLRYVAFVPQLGLCAFIGFWYGHDPARFEEFSARYRAELAGGEQAAALARLAAAAERGTVTLLTATKEVDISQAAVLKSAIEELAGR